MLNKLTPAQTVVVLRHTLSNKTIPHYILYIPICRETALTLQFVAIYCASQMSLF